MTKEKQRRRSAWEEARANLYSANSFKAWMQAVDVFLHTPEFSAYRLVKNENPKKSKWLRVKESVHDKIDLTRDDIAKFDAEVSTFLATLYDNMEAGRGPVVFASTETGHKFVSDVVKMQIAVDAHDRPLYGFVLRFEKIVQETEF
jgi:hypothetical protein